MRRCTPGGFFPRSGNRLGYLGATPEAKKDPGFPLNMLEDWIKAEEAKKIGEGADAKSVAEHVKFWLDKALWGFGWGTPKDVAGVWCTLPDFVRSRPYIEEAFREKMRRSAAEKWDCFGGCKGADWSWDAKFACKVTDQTAKSKGSSAMMQPFSRQQPGQRPGGSLLAPTAAPALPVAPVPAASAIPYGVYSQPAIPAKRGLSTGAKAGIGVGVLAAVGLGAWMIMRKPAGA